MLGERDRAIDFLERYAVNMRPQFVAWIKNDSDLDSLRDNPRYQALIQRMEAKLAEAEGQIEKRHLGATLGRLEHSDSQIQR